MKNVIFLGLTALCFNFNVTMACGSDLPNNEDSHTYVCRWGGHTYSATADSRDAARDAVFAAMTRDGWKRDMTRPIVRIE